MLSLSLSLSYCDVEKDINSIDTETDDIPRHILLAFKCQGSKTGSLVQRKLCDESIYLIAEFYVGLATCLSVLVYLNMCLFVCLNRLRNNCVDGMTLEVMCI